MKRKDLMQHHLTLMINYLHSIIDSEENEDKRLAYVTFDTKIKEAIKELRVNQRSK